jgi:hypothetical protein
MKKLVPIILVAASASIVPSLATGGMKASQSEIEVKIISAGTNRWRMSGSVMGARNSADTNQHIGCETSVTPGGGIGSRNAYCYARTTSMTNPYGVFCSTGDAAMIDAIGTINDTSYIEIVYDQGSTCQHVKITNNSKYATPPVQSGATATGFSQ